jgi:hypothetical protein
MKYLLYVVLLLSYSSRMSAAPSGDTVNRAVITLFSSGYIYPSGPDESLQENGWRFWKDPAASARVFFWPQQAGSMSVALRVKLNSGNAVLRVSMDDGKEGKEVPVTSSSDYVEVPAGVFTVDAASYHYLVIKGVRKSGEYFPQVDAVVVSGEAAAAIRFNRSPYRGAPSTHLRYLVPGDSTVKWMYSEVTVPKEVDGSVNAYYETNGFGGGYTGIQNNNERERRFIFSIWSRYNTNDPKEIPADYAVNLKKKGTGVFTGEFGNEGSGGHSHLVYPWKTGKTYHILTGIKGMAGDSTTYISWYAAPEDNYTWQLLSEWTQNKSGVKPGMTGLYAFVENFGPNGNDFFKAYYGNQWICTPSGNWVELTKCTFSTTANPQKHQRYDYGAGVEGDQFYMFSGGFKKLNNINPGEMLERKAGGKPPAIEFKTLPGW